MSDEDYFSYLEAVKADNANDNLKILDVIPYSNLNSRKLLSLYQTDIRNEKLRVKMILGLDMPTESDIVEFREARRNSAGTLKKGKNAGSR